MTDQPTERVASELVERIDEQPWSFWLTDDEKTGIARFLQSELAAQQAAIVAAERRGAAQAIAIVREVRDGFLSPEYATDQPLSSFQERFACNQAAEAIEQHFGLGTNEQCELLGKPTPAAIERGEHKEQSATHLKENHNG